MKKLKNIINQLNCYIVGGAVRDKLMNIKVNDIDYVVENSTHEEMISLGFKQVGAGFPVYLWKENNNTFEFALCRQEKKTSSGYNGFEMNTKNVSLEDDLMRRDLTINSIAMTKNGEYIDPFNGRKDIENKILRHTSEAFAEDPIRVLRLARFSAKYPDFIIAEETMQLAKTLKLELLKEPKERVLLELRKAFKTDQPSRFFLVLKELNMLEVIPYINQYVGLNQDPKHHGEGDVFNHVLYALDKSPKDELIRLAILYHDFGKIFTKKGMTYHGHDSLDILEKVDLKKQLKITKKEERLIHQAIYLHHRFRDVHKFTKKGIFRFMKSSLFPRDLIELSNILKIIEADSNGRLISTIERSLTDDEFIELLNGSKIKGFILGEEVNFSLFVYHLKFFEELINIKREKLIIPLNSSIQDIHNIERITWYFKINKELKKLQDNING